MKEKKIPDELTKQITPDSISVINSCKTKKIAVNELMKPLGLKIVVIHEESNTEYEPEKLVEIARDSALSDYRFEVRLIGEYNG